MNILVTGGTGEVGQAAVRRLVKNGHLVRVIGRRSGITLPGADYRPCDVTDFAAVCEQVKGMDAIVHLAAIRHAALAPGQEIWRVNCQGTFNIYQAAAEAGIKRVVIASSINAFGYYMGIKNFSLHYFPVDEAHPGFTTDPYSFSKQINEEIAAYFWRREGISGIAIRLPAVYEVDKAKTPFTRDFILELRQALIDLFALPPRERQARAQEVIDATERARQERLCEQPIERQSAFSQAALIFGRSNFWTSLDARDSAQAIEKGLLADYEGSHPVFVNDSHNCTGISSKALVETFFPGVNTWKRKIDGTGSLVSIDRVRELIGFEPQHSINELFEH
ncbi:MAG: NAD(P)-dependent oxidoreductase [Anaerolineae bacterium]|nr:NAD(P)-dependent oxidoreductase [Anaerolineae bacterium]